MEEPTSESSSASPTSTTAGSMASKLSRALFSRGKYENPWSTWQARGPLDALKWTLSRKTPPLPSKEELDRVRHLPINFIFIFNKYNVINILVSFVGAAGG
jgi:hypothetical protein